MFEAFIDEIPDPFAVMFETLMMDGRRSLAKVPNMTFEAFKEERAAPDALKTPVTVSLSIFAPSTTVKAYPGLEAVWTATFP